MKKEILNKVFDELMTEKVERFKDEYINKKLLFNNSEETDSSLAKKAVLVQKYMDQGVDFNDACDKEDVYLGSFDAEYIYVRYILKSHSLSFEEWIEKRFRRDFVEEVELKSKR